jgi:Ser/Thr protein kinase RdoA (MazF antagonist)
VLRLSPKDSGRLEREQWIASIFADNSLIKLVPAVRVQHVALSNECDIVSMRQVTGQPLGAALKSALPATRRTLFAAVGRGLAQIHAQVVRGFSLLQSDGTGRDESWHHCFRSLTEGALQELTVSPLADLRARCEACLQQLTANSELNVRSSLLHGDAQPMNILVQHDQVVAWLDWEFAMGGDALYELAYVETWFEYDYAPWAEQSERTQWRQAFYSGYGEDPFVAQPTKRLLYGLVHALRSTEYSSVVAPTLAPALRTTAIRGMRSRIESFLEQAHAMTK